MRLPDPGASAAVLIGCGRYDDMDPLPAVLHNVSDLSDLLTDPRGWALPGDRCTVLAEPATPAAVIDAVRHAAEQATDTLLVYYAGHGLLDDHGCLHLGTGQTRDHQTHTALSYAYLRDAVHQHSRARLDIVVLDCCYSGSALRGPLAGAGTGSYVLTSSAETETSMSPPGARHTAFSGELIDLLRHGLPGTGPFLTFDQVFQHLSERLATRDLPQPQQAVRNSVTGYALYPNRPGSSPGPTTRAQPAIPPRREPRPSKTIRRLALTAILTTSVAAGVAAAPFLIDGPAPNGSPAENPDPPRTSSLAAAPTLTTPPSSRPRRSEPPTTHTGHQAEDATDPRRPTRRHHVPASRSPRPTTSADPKPRKIEIQLTTPGGRDITPNWPEWNPGETSEAHPPQAGSRFWAGPGSRRDQADRPE
ncbi:caspase family protein [Actinoplanes couchii]|uniref:Peptidase C14 caspase domain-containing protein n=1 Tax=Actinoplanes couchii TaxID=403638 RepID=A0ABQ3X6Y2_9ACTN|nr:caspase family protein [Actinoplanes couchii]MDR6322080.1 hypothetical protein [Actinoplanes couchii]GID54244.1 hypothetical protein Aco03nite_026480 [Actinoplanes couchii]